MDQVFSFDLDFDLGYQIDALVFSESQSIRYPLLSRLIIDLCLCEFGGLQALFWSAQQAANQKSAGLG